MTKPPVGSTVNPAHPWAPAHCFVMHEGQGFPVDIGLAALPIGSGDLPEWHGTEGTRWPGTKHVEYGTGPLLAGQTKFTAVVSVQPANITHTAAWLAKRVSGTDRPTLAFGMTHDAGYGDYIFLVLGDGISVEPFHYGWFGWGTTGGWSDQALPTTPQQLILAYDGSRAAGDRARLWRNGVQIPGGINAGNPARYDEAHRAVASSTAPIWLCQGAEGGEANGEFNGELGYLTLIPNLFPSQADIAALVANPWPFLITSPLLTNLASTEVTHVAATITWTTDIPATSRVEYGVGSYTAVVETPEPVTSHRVPLTGLAPGTAYQCRVQSTIAGPVTATSRRFVGTTLAQPAVIGPLLIDLVSATTMRISVTTDLPTTAVLDYGTTAEYQDQQADDTLGTQHRFMLTDLTPATAYHFRVTVSTAAPVSKTQTSDRVFSTHPTNAAGPGAIVDLAPIRVAQNGARLRWTAPPDAAGRAARYTVKRSLEPITEATFEAATTVEQDLVPSMAGGIDELTVTGLKPNTTYSFALTATDVEGDTSAISNVATVHTLAGRAPQSAWGGDTRIQSPSGQNVGCTFAGVVTGLTTTVLTDDKANFPTDGRLIGKLLCPNIAYVGITNDNADPVGLRTAWYKIVANTPTSVTVALDASDTLTSYAAVGATYNITGVIATEKIGDQWWLIDPEGYGFFPRGASVTLDKWSGSFANAFPYQAIYLKRVSGAMTGNLAAAGLTTAMNPVKAPADVINDAGVTVHAVGDEIYIRHPHPFAHTYFQMQEGFVGAGGAMDWYYSTATGWRKLGVGQNGRPNRLVLASNLYGSGLVNTVWAFNLDDTGGGPQGGGSYDNGIVAKWFLDADNPCPLDWAATTVAGTDGVKGFYIRGVVTVAFKADPKVNACYDMTPNNILLLLRYRHATATIGAGFTRKFRAIGMNFAGYAGSYGDYAASMVKSMPFYMGTLCTYYADTGTNQASKNIYEQVPNSGSVDISTVTAEARHQADMWQPSLIPGVATIVGQWPFRSNPNHLGVVTDEADFLYGMSRGVERTHMGYCLLCTNPWRQFTWQYTTPRITAADPRFFGKYAFRDFLRYRYKAPAESLTAPSRSMTTPLYTYAPGPSTGHDLTALTNLNAAWGTHYTTWGTQSGDLLTGTNQWGTGSGFMDEDGRNILQDGIYPPLATADARAHVSFETLANFVRTPQVFTDIEDFTELSAERYAYVVLDQVRARCRNLVILLLYSPADCVARGLKDYIDIKWTDVARWQVKSTNPLDREPGRAIRQWDLYHKPAIYDVYTTCNQDSPLGYGGVVTAVSYHADTNTTTITYTGAPVRVHNHIDDFLHLVESDQYCKIINFVGTTLSVRSIYGPGDVTASVAVGSHVETPDANAYTMGTPAGARTQAAHAAEDIETIITPLLHARAADGTYPVVGFEKWTPDNPAYYANETTGWGLLTPTLNFYDGVEAMRAGGVDVDGAYYGGEDRDYGNFVTPMKDAWVAAEDTMVLRTTVPVAPTFLSANRATWSPGVLTSFLVVTAGSPRARITLGTGTLPAGVALLDNGDGSAVLGGEIAEAGVFPVTLRATNSAGSVDQTVMLTIAEAGIIPPPVSGTPWVVEGIALFPGLNPLTFTARDAAGNPTDVVLNVTYEEVDTIAPTITITVPTTEPAITVSTDTITLGGTAEDNVAVTEVTWRNDRGGSGAATLSGAAWTVEIALHPGPNVLTMTARDAARNPTDAVLTATYQEADTSPPTIEITAPTREPAITVSVPTITVSGIADDNVGVTEITWRNDRGGEGSATLIR